MTVEREGERRSYLLTALPHTHFHEGVKTNIEWRCSWKQWSFSLRRHNGDVTTLTSQKDLRFWTQSHRNISSVCHHALASQWVLLSSILELLCVWYICFIVYISLYVLHITPWHWQDCRRFISVWFPFRLCLHAFKKEQLWFRLGLKGRLRLAEVLCAGSLKLTDRILSILTMIFRVWWKQSEMKAELKCASRPPKVFVL